MWEAAKIIKDNDAAYQALMEQMKSKASVAQCFAAIESVK